MKKMSINKYEIVIIAVLTVLFSLSMTPIEIPSIFLLSLLVNLIRIGIIWGIFKIVTRLIF